MLVQHVREHLVEGQLLPHACQHQPHELLQQRLQFKPRRGRRVVTLVEKHARAGWSRPRSGLGQLMLPA